jgi:hypothetical protein
VYFSSEVISVGRIIENEMSGARNTHGEEEKCIQNFGTVTLMKEAARKIWV